MTTNINTCAQCPFSICVHAGQTNDFKFMCGFKKEWLQIPVSIFFSIWLEARGKND